jgi:mono/diheme cytochrome c family protein
VQRGGVRFGVLCLSSLLLVAGVSASAAGGAATFQEKCAFCHGDNGQGIQGLAPPLKGSSFVASASEAQLKSQILNGRTGKDRRYRDIPGGMPGVFMPASEMEALVKYVQGDLQR